MNDNHHNNNHNADAAAADDDDDDDDHHGILILLRNLTISVDNIQKRKKAEDEPSSSMTVLLHPLSFKIPSSSLVAILGASGCGKTTLLNVLANRYDQSVYRVEGALEFSRSCKKAYVAQADFLLSCLTVRESLLFNAQLKISKDSLLGIIGEQTFTEALYERLIENVITDLGLSDRANAFIGETGQENRCLSGGERRRVSIALQLLNDPQILFADEPTSGLDTFTARTIIQYFKKLSSGNRKLTILSSIHQPSADIFELFDYALLLSSGGCCIYFGPVAKMIQYFTEMNFPCPINANPADFYVDLASIDGEENIETEKARIQGLISNYLMTHQIIVEEFTETEKANFSGNYNLSTYSVNYFRQFSILLKRFWISSVRDIISIYSDLLQVIFTGFIFIGIFWQLDDSPSGVISRGGLFYCATSAFNSVILSILIDRYYLIIKIMDRELQDELYHPVMFLLAHTVAQIPQFIFQIFLYSIILYFGCDLRPGSDHFIYFTCILFVMLFVVHGMVWFGLSWNRSLGSADFLTYFQHFLFALTIGFMINLKTLPVYIRWLSFVNPTSYCFRLLMLNEFKDRTFQLISGNYILNDYDIHLDLEGQYWYVLFLIMFGYYFIASWNIIRLKFPPTGSMRNMIAQKEGKVENDEKDKIASDSQDENLKESFDSDENELIVGNNDEHVDMIEGYIQLSSRPSKKEVIEDSNEIDNEDNKSDDSIQEQMKSTPLFIDTEFNEDAFADMIISPKSTRSREIEIKVENLNLFVKLSSHSTLKSNYQHDYNSLPNNDERNNFHILKNINLQIYPGRLTALMGGSGSGKTSLLNLLANRIPISCLRRESQKKNPLISNDIGLSSNFIRIQNNQNYSGNGRIFFNGKFPTSKHVRESVGFGKFMQILLLLLNIFLINSISIVPQFDYQLPSLTVRETLDYQAKLRLPVTSTPKEREKCIRDVLNVLGLNSCASFFVGSDEKKGISGGERRRLSIAITLLADPLICLLDEPTTGLDAFTAKHLVDTLKDLALFDPSNWTSNTLNPAATGGGLSSISSLSKIFKKKTIIMAIHQPRYDIFQAIDDLILISKRSLLWSGPIDEMLKHFQSLGFSCPSCVNPADFVLELSSIDVSLFSFI
jgi:ABC-type multidrug transport system ATPase subunit/ABC-type multidrug transport system permease subunit